MDKPLSMRIHLCQTDIHWESPSKNFASVAELFESVSLEAGDLIVLPEMYATGFSMNTGATAEPADGPGFQFLRKLATDTGCAVLGGLTTISESDASPVSSRPRNQAVFLTPEGQEVSRYDKTYPFSLGGEDQVFEAGNGMEVFEWGGIRWASAICYDLRFPELFRSAVDLGAECFLVIANWPEKRVDHWTTLIKARAIENQAICVGVNRTGSDPFHQYCGHSLACDPLGLALVEITSKESVLSFTPDMDGLRTWREKFPALDDRSRHQKATKAGEKL